MQNGSNTNDSIAIEAKSQDGYLQVGSPLTISDILMQASSIQHIVSTVIEQSKYTHLYIG